MNLILALDNKTAKDLEHLAPHKNCLDLNKPRSLSAAASLPKPVASTIARWMHHNDNGAPIAPHKLAFLESVAEH